VYTLRFLLNSAVICLDFLAGSKGHNLRPSV